jgi:putative holliday junction resolvase
MALDLGTKRIGVAVSDLSGTIATPLTVLDRTGSHRRDHARIAALIAEEEAVRLVVGLPLSLDGTMGAAARAAQTEAEELTSVVGVPVETFDERMTTTTAHTILQPRMRARARRRVVDKVAAAVILQTWLDGGRGRAKP